MSPVCEFAKALSIRSCKCSHDWGGHEIFLFSKMGFLKVSEPLLEATWGQRQKCAFLSLENIVPTFCQHTLQLPCVGNRTGEPLLWHLGRSFRTDACEWLQCQQARKPFCSEELHGPQESRIQTSKQFWDPFHWLQKMKAVGKEGIFLYEWEAAHLLISYFIQTAPLHRNKIISLDYSSSVLHPVWPLAMVTGVFQAL